MWERKLNRHCGRPLTAEQAAVAAVLAQAISNYSEDRYCAGWLIDIEHQLWERLNPREPDDYERAVTQLYTIAGEQQPCWGKTNEEFLAGLKIIAEQEKVWVYYGEDHTAIHLDDWLPMHAAWHERSIRQRPTLEEVWERIYNPFPWSKRDKPLEVPPMPKLRQERNIIRT